MSFEVIAEQTEEFSLEIVQESDHEFSLNFTFVVGSGGGGTQIQSDWNQTDPDEVSFIKGKPTVPTQLSELTDDETHRTVTDDEKRAWNDKAASNHNHDGVYDPAGTAAGAVSSHESSYDHSQLELVSEKEDIGVASGLMNTHVSTYHSGNVWNPVINVSRDSDTYINTQASSEPGAVILANSLPGKLAQWTDSTGNTKKRGFVLFATAEGKTVHITLRGDTFTATDINFRLAINESVRITEYFVPGELMTDAATDIGYEFIVPTSQVLRAVAIDAHLKVAAAGAGADLQYDLFDDGAGIMTSDPTFGSGTSVLNSPINNSLIAGGSRLSLRITASAGGTSLAQGLSVILYWAFDDLFNAI